MRCISSQQAAVALRPFYFAVHPDRFANNPEIRAHNERSLQVSYRLLRIHDFLDYPNDSSIQAVSTYVSCG